MTNVDEAHRLVLIFAKPLSIESASLSASMGLVLAEDVSGDLDMPPYDTAPVAAFGPEGRFLALVEEHKGKAKSLAVFG